MDKWKIIFYCLGLSLIHFNGFSQESADTIRRYEIHAMPLCIIDYTPHYRIGFEYHSDKHLAYALDFGYGNSVINGFMNIGYVGDTYSLFEGRGEVKYYFKESHADIQPYMSLEFFSISMSNVFYDDYFHHGNTSLITNFDRATMHKQKTGFHVKAGLKLYSVNRISVDLYAGMGIAIREFVYKDVVNPEQIEEEIWYEWFLPVYKFEERKTIYHMTMGLKFGYYW